MSNYVLVNVQGVHDVTTRVFNSLKDIDDYLTDFFDEEEEYSKDDILPYGEINRDFQTLKVIRID